MEKKHLLVIHVVVNQVILSPKDEKDKKETEKIFFLALSKLVKSSIKVFIEACSLSTSSPTTAWWKLKGFRDILYA